MANEDFQTKLMALSDALEMVEDAIEAARLALFENPEKDRRRRLNELILELEAKKAKITNKIIALARKQTAIKRPTKAQLDELKTLAAKVDELTRNSENAVIVIDAGGEVLALVEKVNFA
jgi:predicted  nucleic acid-binding Zn-ribbon protein